MKWIKAVDHLYEFNGLVSTVRLPQREIGLFCEPYLGKGRKWAIRFRPWGSNINAVNICCWGYPRAFKTKRQALEWAEQFALDPLFAALQEVNA